LKDERSSSDIWTDAGASRYFLIPDRSSLPAGSFPICTRTGRHQSVNPDALAAFEVTEDQARRWAKDQLGHTLDELKAGIDEKLGELRQQLADFNARPVADSTTITPNAASALFDLLKALPGVVGQSISGDGDRVASARAAMADLQRRLKESGIDVDDRMSKFPDRLASIRRKPDEDA
jgi:hypothetical protein